MAYQTTPPPAGDAPFVYVLKGALTEHQGRLPPDAFEGEDDIPETENDAETTEK